MPFVVDCFTLQMEGIPWQKLWVAMREGVGGLSHSMRTRAACALLTGLAALALTSCGAPGIPQPPSLHLPQPVTDLHAIRKGDKVRLAWSVPDRTTDGQLIKQMGPTQICRGAEAQLAQCGTPVGEVAPPVATPAEKSKQKSGAKITQEFVDVLPSALMKNDAAAQVTYAVAVLNTNGRSAGLSNEARVPAMPTIAPPQLHAEISAEGVELTATSLNAPVAAAGLHYFFRIYRQEKGGDMSSVAGEVPWSDSLEYVDHAFTWEKSYLYRVTVVTAISGAKPPEMFLEGDDSSQVEIFAHDVFPPAVPSGLQAVFSGETQPSVDLVWSPDADADLDGYNVYRSEDGGAVVKINSRLIKTPAFRDTGVKSGKTYSYAVSGVDVRGNESERSKEASESVP